MQDRLVVEVVGKHDSFSQSNKLKWLQLVFALQVVFLYAYSYVESEIFLSEIVASLPWMLAFFGAGDIPNYLSYRCCTVFNDNGSDSLSMKI